MKMKKGKKKKHNPKSECDWSSWDMGSISPAQLGEVNHEEDTQLLGNQFLAGWKWEETEVVIWTDILKLPVKGCCWDQMCKVGIRISNSQITHLSPEKLIHLFKSHLSTRQSTRPPDLWLWALPPLLEHQMVFLKQSCSQETLDLIWTHV